MPAAAFMFVTQQGLFPLVIANTAGVPTAAPALLRGRQSGTLLMLRLHQPSGRDDLSMCSSPSAEAVCTYCNRLSFSIFAKDPEGYVARVPPVVPHGALRDQPQRNLHKNRIAKRFCSWSWGHHPSYGSSRPLGAHAQRACSTQRCDLQQRQTLAWFDADATSQGAISQAHMTREAPERTSEPLITIILGLSMS